MTIQVIGLGSMGRRRIRCLQALGHTDIYGYDTREDRRNSAKNDYGIKTNFCEAPDVVFISLPPKLHREYSERYKHIPCFVEAGTERLNHGSPSCTMMYHPQVQELQRELPNIGKLVNISYHSGQYLPDWHPYEKVSDYYVAETGALEMVAFELMWFTQVFANREQVNHVNICGRPASTAQIPGLTAPDTVVLYGSVNDTVFSMTIDVISRTSTRQLIINGAEKQLRYDLNEGISEQMYIDETKAFLDGTLQNTLEHNNKVIGILEQIA